jgi:O-acetyl-ADP-ribose deacetylase (regulator of RNase III)
MSRSLVHRISLVVGDITRLDVDAVVNAANEALCGGGGVDGAIHRAAGPGLLEECRKLGGCNSGDAKITSGHRLPAKHIIHTVGPIWEGGTFGEAKTLRSCYRTSLTLAEKHGVGSIAFPCVSTGIFGYPKSEACAIAFEMVREWLETHEAPGEVIFCCFGEEDAELYRERLGAAS